jgi:hypothetical protein
MLIYCFFSQFSITLVFLWRNSSKEFIGEFKQEFAKKFLEVLIVF